MATSAPNDMHASTVIRASAGTGKTYRLAMRYIGLLARGEHPSSLLATTFTKKAAGEMLERVLKFLSGGATKPEKLVELQKFADPTLTHQRCRLLLRLLVANLHRNNVLNIDKLFLRLASGFSLDLGVAPGWQLVDPDEDRTMRVQALSTMLAENPKQTTLTSLIGLAKGGNPSAVHAPILNALNVANFQFLAAKRALAPWQVIKPETKPLSGSELDERFNNLRRCEQSVPRNKDGSRSVQFEKAIRDACEDIVAHNWKDFLSTGIAAKLCTDSQETYSRKEIPSAISDCYYPLIAHAVSHLRTQLFDSNTALHELILSFNTHYTELKALQGTFLFDDIPQLLLELPYEGGRDHIYFKLDTRVRHILLDEFQDTSLQQFELLEPLITECLSSDDGRSMFIVGDTKQSLYAWRGAEPGLLRTLDSKLGLDEDQVLDLALNFRSSPAIIDAVNTVCGNLETNAAFIEKGSNAATSWQSTFQTHRAHHADQPGEVILSVSPDVAETDSESKFDLLATYTAQRVKAMHDSAPAASIAILLRRNKWIAALRFELSQLGIESSQEGGGPLTDSPAVCAILSLFHLSTHPADTVARYHLATSPLGKLIGLTDHRSSKQAIDISRHIRTEILIRGVTPALISLRHKLLPFLAQRDHARLTQLIAFGAAFDAKGNPDPDEFCDAVTNRAMVDPNPARVRIMSIHKAKGLEFDAVFLPQFEGAWQRRPNELYVERQSPFDPPSLLSQSAAKELAEIDPELSQLRDSRFETLVGEELCCLYVGMTRARHHLEIIVPPEKPKDGGNPSASRVYCEGLAPGKRRDPLTTLYSHTLGDWKTWKRDNTKSTTPTPAPIALNFSKSTTVNPLHLPRTSPSSLEGSSSPIASDILRPRHDQSLDRGTLIHAWFELVEWASSPLPSDAALLAHAARIGIPESSTAPQLPDFKAMLAMPDIRKSLSLPDSTVGTWRLKKEWPFSVQIIHNRRPTMLSGRFDRVHICYLNDKPIAAHILDFKTDSLTTAPIEKSIETYRPQMAAYRSALAVLLKLDPATVAASLLFVARGDVVEV